MVPSYNIVTIYLLTVLLSAQSQFYGQYGYQPYYQYPVYNPSYVPYPYASSQPYQPYVSSQPNYFPYYTGYPTQNYPTQNYPTQNYPTQNFPTQNYPTYYNTQQYNPAAQPGQIFYPTAYSGGEYVPNVYTSNTPTAVGTQQYNPLAQPTQVFYPTANSGAEYVPNGNTPNTFNSSAAVRSTPTSQTISNFEKQQNRIESDPYANIRTDIIDIEPQYFHYYKRFFNLEDNLYPIEVIDDERSSRTPQVNGSSYQPSYIVKSESKQTNITNVPYGVKKHDVQTKTFSFKKTFTINPDRKENAVVNLNFVNGVEVTTKKPEQTTSNHTTTILPIDGIETTTENEEPGHVDSWFG